MAQKHRVALTLNDELDSVLTTLSKLTSSPKTAIITELLMESLPVFHTVINAIEAARLGQQQAVVDSLAGFLQDASGIVNQAHIDFGEMKGVLKGKSNDK